MNDTADATWILQACTENLPNDICRETMKASRTYRFSQQWLTGYTIMLRRHTADFEHTHTIVTLVQVHLPCKYFDRAKKNAQREATRMLPELQAARSNAQREATQQETERLASKRRHNIGA